MNNLSITLPEGLVSAVARRHHGNKDITETQRADSLAEMKSLWERYQKTKAKLDYCEGDWWETMKVESHYKESRWYYAHKKRKRLMGNVRGLHERMFTLLTHTDGNYGQSFDPFWCISAEECYLDLIEKYGERTG